MNPHLLFLHYSVLIRHDSAFCFVMGSSICMIGCIVVTQEWVMCSGEEMFNVSSSHALSVRRAEIRAWKTGRGGQRVQIQFKG